MSRRERLVRRDFIQAQSGRSYRSGGKYFLLQVFALPEHAQNAKFACVVSKQVSLKAAERNLVKRRCREVLRRHVRSVKKPVALVLRAKRSALGASFAEVQRDIRALVEKVSDKRYNTPT